MVTELFRLLAEPLRTHIDDVALALVATVLVVSGDKINELLRLVVRKQRLWLRLSAFIVLCSVGYGALSVWLTPLVREFLLTLPAIQLLLVVIGGFVTIAVIAQKQRKI